ncbi:FtsK/SpoIIIE domain-containing protein [Novipirellula rosea]|uniref:FtsK/SpoIIIE domain-containing protein n=1 Tax=Novipirellula rosea TaxID=1031540 RepID=UPI0031EBDC91
MKDSSVGPAGLLHPARQRRLLEGLEDRFRSSVAEHQSLIERHAKESESEETTLGSQRAIKTDACRHLRRGMLLEWDEQEEKLTSQYEAFAIKNRQELNRLGAVYRKKASVWKDAIERKVKARCTAIHHQYNERKDKPGIHRDKEIEQINQSLNRIYGDLEWARALTLRRLDRLPEVPPAETPEDNQRLPTPHDVRESIEAIDTLTRRCKQTVAQMQTGAASKIVDSFYLPAGVGVFIVIWALAVMMMKFDPPWLPMAAGVPIAGVIGFTIFLLLMMPLKRMTRQLHPVVERIAEAAEEAAEAGRKIAARTAKEAEVELLNQRDAHLETAARWRTEQLTLLEQTINTEREQAKQKLLAALSQANAEYKSAWNRVSETMLAKADTLANRISTDLADTDQTLTQQRIAAAERRDAERARLVQRLENGVQRGLRRISESTSQVRSRFPDWQNVADGDLPAPSTTDFLPVGRLKVDRRLRHVLETSANQNGSPTPAHHSSLPSPVAAESVGDSVTLADINVPESLPIVLHRRLHCGLLISANSSGFDQAIDVAHQVLWRVLTGSAPGRAKLTLIDPVGRGQNFTSFMALADHDPSLVGHRVWTSETQVTERLGEIAQHIEDVLQSSLRDRFQRIEDYNELAGSMAEPYRVIAAIGFPEGLTRDGYKHLQALLESGLRCGIFCVIVCDKSKPWPAETPLPKTDKLLRLDLNDDGEWRVVQDGLDDLPFEPDPSPPMKLRSALVDQVGKAAVAASRVEIPLADILKDSQAAGGSTADRINIPIGSQGANRHLPLDLGEGVRQHVLIAGKTGSGKSTLLHAIITSGAYRYTPDELQYYLLDFKKGVEFKPYADASFPHARVIGIESEREFGRSVLQRLDEELQQRGEKFRAAGVQELGEYRKASGQKMPRIMLVVDEFQELFIRDDRLAGDCAMLLDRLVRQGRSFGMHVILSSQSLAGAYSLPRATLGQMAVRIAMQCSEADAALILADDNTAARLISRPGEAIYNDAGGLIEGNQPFQVAWLSGSAHREMLHAIAIRDQGYVDSLPPAVVFEGNRPCRWTPLLANQVVPTPDDKSLYGLLGEAVEIGPPVAVKLTRDTGRNLLVMAPADSRGAVIATCVASFCKSDPRTEVVYFDGARVDDGESVGPWLSESGIPSKIIKLRDVENEIVRVHGIVKERMKEDGDSSPIILVIDPLERFRDLRQDESFNFSLDAAAGPVSGATALQECLRDGPAVNVFTIVVSGSAETLSRWLPRASQHDLELRVLGRMNASDSALLIDTPMASELSAATMLLYDDTDGRISKFRQCDLPNAHDVKIWLTPS